MLQKQISDTHENALHARLFLLFINWLPPDPTATATACIAAAAAAAAPTAAGTRRIAIRSKY